MVRQIAVFILILSTGGLAQVAPQKHPFTFEDMMALKRISEPVVSPDGKWVAFSANEINLQANTKTPHLWVFPLAGGEAWQLTSGEKGEDRPRWSPDGKRMAYISPKGADSQVWIVRLQLGNRSACRRAQAHYQHLIGRGQRVVVAGWEEHHFRFGGVSRVSG